VAGVAVYLAEQELHTAESIGLTIVRHGGADRILRGQAAARAISTRFGRPPIALAKMDKAKITLTAGKGVCQAGQVAGISAAAVSRLKHSMGIAARLLWSGEIPGYRPSIEDVRQQLN
jgi:hypothetical protein